MTPPKKNKGPIFLVLLVAFALSSTASAMIKLPTCELEEPGYVVVQSESGYFIEARDEKISSVKTLSIWAVFERIETGCGINKSAFYKHLDTGYWLDLNEHASAYILRESKPKYAFREYRAGDGVYTMVLRGQKITAQTNRTVIAQPETTPGSIMRIEKAPQLYAMSGGMSFPEDIEEGMECEIKLSFAFDTSGSMDWNGLSELQLATEAMVNSAPADKWQVSLDLFSNEATTPFGPEVIHSRGSNSPHARFREAVNNIAVGGGTSGVAGLLMADHSLTNDENSYQPSDGRPRIAVLVSDGGFVESDEAILAAADSLKNDNNITIITIGLGLGGGDRAIMEQVASARNGQQLYFDVDVHSNVDSMLNAFTGVAAEFCGPVILKTALDDTVTASGGQTTGSWQLKMNPLWEYGAVDVRLRSFAMSQIDGIPVQWGTVSGAGLNQVLTLHPGANPIEGKFLLNIADNHITQSIGDSMVTFSYDRRVPDGSGGNDWIHLGSGREFATSYPFSMTSEINWLQELPEETGLGATGASFDMDTKVLKVRMELTTNNEFPDMSTLVPVTASAMITKQLSDGLGGLAFQYRPEWVVVDSFTPLNGIPGVAQHVVEFEIEYTGAEESLDGIYSLNAIFHAAGQTHEFSGSFTVDDDGAVFLP